MTRNRKRNNFQNTFKDYLVPIIGGALLLLILFSVFNKSDSNTNQDAQVNSDENRVPVDITFDSAETSAFIEYPNGSNEEITDDENLYKGETIIVREGSLNLSISNGTDISLNKIAEFKYTEDNDFSLYSSDAWITLGEDSNITMKYASVSANAGTVLSLTQNEAGSTVYVLSGSAKVSNLEGISTSLVKGQKVSIARQYAASEDIDLSSEKGTIDSYFKGSDWFIDNKGFEILEQEDTEETTEEIIVGESGDFLSFNSLQDEMSTSEGSINISGNILNSEVDSITINNRQAGINTLENTFSLDNLTLGSSINDIVIKTYAGDKSILEKKVITVYSSNQSSTSSSTVNTTTASVVTPVASSGGATFGADATDFGFTAPSVTGKFVATGSEITIRGITSAEGISKVEVNGFELASFNGSTWRYHAFERFETLEEGTNQYKIDYYGADGSLVYTDYYTIVKNAATTTVAEETTSEEATVE